MNNDNFTSIQFITLADIEISKVLNAKDSDLIAQWYINPTQIKGTIDMDWIDLPDEGMIISIKSWESIRRMIEKYNHIHVDIITRFNHAAYVLLSIICTLLFINVLMYIKFIWF